MVQSTSDASKEAGEESWLVEDISHSAAIATVVTVAEILKNNGVAVEKNKLTLTVDMGDEPGERPVPKAKIEIVLGKTDHFDELMATEAEQREYAENEEQN